LKIPSVFTYCSCETIHDFYLSLLAVGFQVKLEQGLQLVKIFKDHASKTSILDDFAFYENRQKIMLEKKAKQHQPPKQACFTNALYCAL